MMATEESSTRDYYLLVCFFNCDGTHRVLTVLTHSYPTRRSSDLHFGRLEHLLRGRQVRCANAHIGVIVNADAEPRTGLDEHLVAMRAQFSCAGRCQANAIFMVLDLSRRADAHARLLASEAPIIVRDRESDPREVHPSARMHNPRSADSRVGDGGVRKG